MNRARLEAARQTAAVQKLVAQAPPLTEEQQRRLGAILRPARVRRAA